MLIGVGKCIGGGAVISGIRAVCERAVEWAESELEEAEILSSDQLTMRA